MRPMVRADLLDGGDRVVGRGLHAGDLACRSPRSPWRSAWRALFTSEATTAKPRPASPARAASMVALSASRLVCSAIAVMSRTTSPMRLAACDSSPMRASVCCAWLHRFAGDPARLLHLAADLVDRRRQLVGRRGDRLHVARCLSEVEATTPESCWVCSAVCVSVAAAASSSVGGRRDRVDDVADRLLEAVGQPVHLGLAHCPGARPRPPSARPAAAASPPSSA